MFISPLLMRRVFFCRSGGHRPPISAERCSALHKTLSKSAIEKQTEHVDTAGIAAMHTADNFACNYDFFVLKFTGANHRQEGTS